MKAHVNSGDFQLAPEGSHFCRLIRIIDLGTTYNEMYSKNQHKICLMYELTSCLMEADDKGVQRPFIIAEFPTLTMSELGNLRARIVTWRGKDFVSDEEAEDFDISKMLNAPGLMTIIHSPNSKGKMKAKPASVISCIEGMEKPKAINPLVFIDFDDFDMKTFETLSDGMQKQIKESNEWKELIGESKTEQPPAAALPDEMPVMSENPAPQQQPAPNAMPSNFDDDISF